MERKLASSKYAFPAAMVLSMGVAAAVALKNCEPAVDSNRTPAASSLAVPGFDSGPGPRKDDGRCEIDKGEHDPLSVNFDISSCGYCGDGVAQPHETPENCPVDFHCGNGRLDKNAVYAGYVNTNGTLTLSTIAVSESCDTQDPGFCQADCGHHRPECTPEVEARIRSRVQSQILSNPQPWRELAGSVPDQSVSVRYSGTVTVGGTAVLGSVRLVGPNFSVLAPADRTLRLINLDGLALHTEADCSFSGNITIPSE